jgi:hypothetical protein
VSAALDVQGTALRAIGAGISVVQVREDGSKRPALSSWQEFQKRRPSPDEVRAWWAARARGGVALVCGDVSGGLEALDFDQRDAFADFMQLCLAAGLGDLFQRVADGYHERSPRGVHLVYRCPDAKTTKLASRGGSCAVETRGEGSYIIAAPTDGYEMVSGSLETIATITDEERAQLHDVARALTDEARPIEAPTVEPIFARYEEGDRPGDEWARHHTWEEILRPHGWARLWTRGGITYWRRPGKARGVSATTNYGDSDLLYVFSTSTAFEANRGYGKFGAYALIEHGGDFERAARRLAEEGYGSRVAHDDVDLSALMGAPTVVKADSDAFPMHLLDVPGIVGELARYTIASAAKPQPVLALASAIVTCAALFGRRVRTETGVWPNVYAIGLAGTGAGKERTRGAPRQALTTVNLANLLGIDDVTSDAAIYGYLQDCPSAAAFFDEFGHLVREFAERRGANIIATLTKLYGLSGAECLGKTYAKDRRTNRAGSDVVVKNPSLSVYGTSVPHRFWEAIDSGDVVDGFLNRFLIFASDDPDPVELDRTDSDREVPAMLVRMLEPWGPGFGRGVASDPLAEAAPAVYLVDQGARDVFHAFGQEIRTLRAEARKSADHVGNGLWARAREQAIKLALIRAASQCSPEDGVVREADATWGVELVRWCTRRTAASIAAQLGDSDHDRMCKQAIAWLEEKGEPVSRRDFARRFQRWTPRELSAVLQTLVESGQVVAGTLPRKPGARGPSKKVLILAAHYSGNLSEPVIEGI